MILWLKRHWKGVVAFLMIVIGTLFGLEFWSRATKGKVRGRGDKFTVGKDPHFILLGEEPEQFKIPDGKTVDQVRAAKYVGPGKATVEMRNAKLDDI